MSSSFSNRITQISIDHSRKVKESGVALSNCIEAWLAGDDEKAQKYYMLLEEIEEEGNQIKDKLIREIAEVDNLGLIGNVQNLSSLVLKTDQLIDYSEGTAQRLINLTWHDIPNTVQDKAIELSNAIMEALKLVRDAYYAIGSNPDRVLKICREIDVYEKTSDKIFRDLEKILYSDDLKDVSLRKILPFLDAMEHLEDIGDIAESVADSIRILYISRYGST
ncbi:MAG: DUF47 domain-containing protein [Promethearchaeota archaeon]